MNLTQLINAVYTETARQDLIAETLQAVLEATLSLHLTENWYKDVQECDVVFDQPSWYVQTLDTSTLPYYRNMAFLRKTNPTTTVAEQTNTLIPNNPFNPPGMFNFLKKVDIGDVVDGYGYEKLDVWYQAGQQINIKSSTPLQYLVAGYYRFPNCDPTGVNFSSWIADQFPYAIIYKAAGGVYAKIGEDKSWAIYMKPPIPGQGEETGGIYYQQLALLKRANITAGVE